MSTLQQLYDSEIKFLIQSRFAGGFDWKLGDDLNGYRARGHAKTYDEAVEALAQAAREHYPDSDFAQTRRRFA